MTTLSILDAQQMSAQATSPNAACEAGFAHALEEAKAHTDSPHPPPSQAPPESQVSREEGASPQAQKTPGTELDPLTETQDSEPSNVDPHIVVESTPDPNWDGLTLALFAQQAAQIAVTNVFPTPFEAQPVAQLESMTPGHLQTLSEEVIPVNAGITVAAQASMEAQHVETGAAPHAPATALQPTISEPEGPRLAVDAERIATGTTIVAPEVLDELQPVSIVVSQVPTRKSPQMPIDVASNTAIEAVPDPMLVEPAAGLTPDTSSKVQQAKVTDQLTLANEPAPASNPPAARSAQAVADPLAKPAKIPTAASNAPTLPSPPNQGSEQQRPDVSSQGPKPNDQGGVATATPVDPRTGLPSAQPRQPLGPQEPGTPPLPNSPLTPTGQPRQAVPGWIEPESTAVNGTESELATQLDVALEGPEHPATKPLISGPNLHEGPRDLTATRSAPDAAQAKSITDAQRLDTTMRQIESHLDAIAARSPNKVVIHLQPYDLGTVVLNIEAREGKIDASVAASNPEVRAALEQSRHQIAASLERRGVSVGEVTVSEQTTFLGDRSESRHQQRNPEADETARMVRMRGLDDKRVRHAVSEVSQRSHVATFGWAREVNVLI